MSAYIAFAALLWIYAVSSLAIIDLVSSIVGVVVCGIWAFVGYIVGIDEGMNRND